MNLLGIDRNNSYTSVETHKNSSNHKLQMYALHSLGVLPQRNSTLLEISYTILRLQKGHVSASRIAGSCKDRFWLQSTRRRRLYCSESVQSRRVWISQAPEANHEAGDTKDEKKLFLASLNPEINSPKKHDTRCCYRAAG